MFIFTENKDFYPTPDKLIDKMVKDVDFHYVNSILEPSAGKGNIVDYLYKKNKNKWGDNKYSYEVDCVEIDENLQHILRGKGYNVVFDDFLKYNTYKEYDLIIANVPFSNGAKHILKMIEMQERNGGGIITLCNAETIRNQCNNDRVTLNRLLSKYNATIEFIENAFIGSIVERETSVEIALIKVKLPEVKHNSFILDELNRAKEVRDIDDNMEEGQIVENDFLKSIINQYELEAQAGIKLIKEYKAMQPFILSEFGKDKETGKTIQTGGCILSLDLSNNRYKNYSNKLSINGFLEDLRAKYWNALFSNEKFIGSLTSNLRQDFYNKVKDLRKYDFNKYNIMQVQKQMKEQISTGVEETILKLFDELSHKNSYYGETCGNIHLYNGWKTNKSYIINKKVIIPYSGFETHYDGSKTFRPIRVYQGIYDKLKDIEKVFNYLDNGRTENIDLEESLTKAESEGSTKKVETKYFTIDFYKKGTTHLVFKDDELLKKFNIFGSQKKGWLPHEYGKKKYKDMTKEEKEVIDNFEGEKEYEKVVENKKYYLFSVNNIMMIEQQ